MAAGHRFEGVLRDDYLMRLVRQLADALARIAGLRKAGLLEEAANELDTAFASLGGIDPLLVRDGDANFLLSLVQDPARREALGRLLEERDALRVARAAAR
jgi:hypothetical protein